MATTRVRTKQFGEVLVPDLEWTKARLPLGTITIPGLDVRIIDGPALITKPTRVPYGGFVQTLTDQIGSPDPASLSRYFPDKRPYRPMTFTGPRDYTGTGPSKPGEPSAPAASAAHTVRTWTFEPIDTSVANLAYLDRTFASWKSGHKYSYGGTRSQQVDYVEVQFWGWDGEYQTSDPSIATSIAASLGAAALPNLIKSGWVKRTHDVCVLRQNYGAYPVAGVKSLSPTEQASLLDSRRVAYESMVSQSGGTQMNVLRSVLELKDLPETAMPLGSFLKTATAVNYLKHMKHLNASQIKRLSSLTLGQLAAIHLWYQFGVKPTVQDAERVLASLSSTAVANITASDAGLLSTGQTVRSAYSIDTGVGEKRLDNLFVCDDQTYVKTYSAGVLINPVLDAMKAFRTTVALPEGNEWRHNGLLFARALKPNWDRMPDWFVTLYGADGSGWEGYELARPSKDELALYFNPPLKSIWNILGYSWLSDWAFNVSQLLTRVERAMSSMVVCSFEEMWAIDRWVYAPRKWSVIPIYQEPSVKTTEVAPYVVPSSGYSFFPGVGWKYFPVIRFYSACTPPQPLTATVRGRYNFVLQTPPTSQWENVSRGQIPIPPIRLPHWFEGKLDAWRIGILCALSVVRLQSMSSALRKANWSIAKCIAMWHAPKTEINYRMLALAVSGVLAAKEFTHE